MIEFSTVESQKFFKYFFKNVQFITKPILNVFATSYIRLIINFYINKQIHHFRVQQLLQVFDI